ncbi:Efflux pump apf11 [Colletotrichum orbiculare MAFF 240422]|uniref:Efflux pump apf11 n=1 Tax=Colletotrichum orbiculare (strain 104-T / ATCC 96160 / CBS 514.97 / LARS 414 / MAFF 240422) TaxID=1213857 RepID=A0A484FSC8_COLOR|nr:Efflux pump apf11 [Colletotrichum orbiculare MAFF 240422]
MAEATTAEAGGDAALPNHHGDPDPIPSETSEKEQQFPDLIPRVLMVTALGLGLLMAALDATMVATIVPTLTDEFQSVKDVGWYGSVFLLVAGSTQPTFGKLYTVFDSKAVFLISLVLLAGGSLTCALSRNSGSFIAGRALSGLGSAGCISGALIITAAIVPLRQRPLFTSILGSLEGVAVALGPIVGGSIASRIGWRWCFYISLPVCGALFLVLAFLFHPPKSGGPTMHMGAKIKQLDFIGGVGLVGSITCLLLALEWGSTRYAWKDAKMVGLLVAFGVSFVAVAAYQHWLGEKATFPTRLLKNRSFTACLWYGFSISSAQMVVLYYLPIWFQAVQGVSSRESGVHLLPVVLSLIASGVLGGIGASILGQMAPFMVAATVLADKVSMLLETARPSLLKALKDAIRWVSTNKAETGLGAVAAALLLLNLKRFPFVWHARVFYNIFWPKRNYFERKPGSVFKPVVTPSRVALLETDYNLHKSNSTYFSDLDVARTDLLAALRAQAIGGGLYKEYKNGVMVLLAGTSCTFKKEIKPGVAFDMHSRILAWDRKWLYVVTYFVERTKDSERKTTYQPWTKPEDGKPPAESSVVYATAISKCVVKAGRLTVPPAKFLSAAGVLNGEDADDAEDAEASEAGQGQDGWTWARVEAERQRNLAIASGFANALDAAHEEFSALS